MLALLLYRLRWMSSRFALSAIALKVKLPAGLSLQPCVALHMLLVIWRAIRCKARSILCATAKRLFGLLDGWLKGPPNMPVCELVQLCCLGLCAGSGCATVVGRYSLVFCLSPTRPPWAAEQLRKRERSARWLVPASCKTMSARLPSLSLGLLGWVRGDLLDNAERSAAP